MAPNNEIFDKVGNVANDIGNTLSENLSNAGTKISETIKETVKEVLTTPSATSQFVSHIFFLHISWIIVNIYTKKTDFHVLLKLP